MREKILKDLIDAMKNQNKEVLTVLRSVKGAIQLEEINKKHELSDEEVIGVLSHQIKTRKESSMEFEKANRMDLKEQTDKEIEILNTYMPEQLSEEELIKIIDEVFDLVKPESVKDMGKVMAYLNPKLKGKTDMSHVSQIIKERINK